MSEPAAIALIGAGTIGTFHAESLARRVPGARLAALADPNEAAMTAVRARLGLESLRGERDYQVLLADPELGRPEALVPWEIFLETMIHDFDVLRWLAASEPAEIYAMADALIAPEYRSRGLLDTALVSVRFANGALASADASFQAVYGYDVRAEVFGSRGMVMVGDGRADSSWHYGPAGASRQHIQGFLELFQGAYVAELQHFAECVRGGTEPLVTGKDGRASLAMALAAVRSFQTRQPVGIEG